MTHTIEDLRTRLFDAIDGVKAGTMSTEQATIICGISQVIVNSAKVEVDFVRATERRSSQFLGAADDGLPNGILSVRQHRIK
jgi:hypothetical protein